MYASWFSRSPTVGVIVVRCLKIFFGKTVMNSPSVCYASYRLAFLLHDFGRTKIKGLFHDKVRKPREKCYHGIKTML